MENPVVEGRTYSRADLPGLPIRREISDTIFRPKATGPAGAGLFFYFDGRPSGDSYIDKTINKHG